MHSRWNLRYFILVGVVVAGLVPGRLESQSKLLTTEQLTDRAEIVVIGKVTALNSAWSSDRKKIFTRVTLTVEQYLKGDQSLHTLTLVVPGGEVNETGEVYSHVARFKSNEDVVVFAQRDVRALVDLAARLVDLFGLEARNDGLQQTDVGER